jgi:glycosyltransferase involved in cell wall biosynthesis
MNSSPIKIAYVVSQIDKALAFEWIVEGLDSIKFELIFILMSPGSSELERYLSDKKIKTYTIHYNGKKDLLKSVLKIYQILKREHVQIVHAHLFEASLAGMIAAALARIRKRIYSRHYSMQHHEYFPAAVKYDRLINRLSTDIVAISRNVKDVLMQKENVNENKIHLIHHGFKNHLFEKEAIDFSRISGLRKKYNIENKKPVVGVIARFIHLKGIQFIIPAFKKLLDEYPDAVLILANADGSYKLEIEKLLQELPPGNFREIKFENDIFALYHLFDVFVHVPINKECEAFGQTYVEALAAGIPSVFTLSGVASEFIEDRKNACVVPYKDVDSIYNALSEILKSPEKFQPMIEQGKKDVQRLFPIQNMIQQFENLYKR